MPQPHAEALSSRSKGSSDYTAHPALDPWAEISGGQFSDLKQTCKYLNITPPARHGERPCHEAADPGGRDLTGLPHRVAAAAGGTICAFPSDAQRGKALATPKSHPTALAPKERERRPTSLLPASIKRGWGNPCFAPRANLQGGGGRQTASS